jgi:hypothetical protein
LDALSGKQSPLTDAHLGYIASVLDQYRQSGQPSDVFLQQYRARQPQRADFFVALAPATQAVLRDQSPKSPDDLRPLLAPRDPEADKQAQEAITQALHETARTTAVQSFLQTVVQSMDYALGASSTLTGVRIDTQSIAISPDGSFACQLLSPNGIMHTDLRVTADGEVQMTNLLHQGGE